MALKAGYLNYIFEGMAADYTTIPVTHKYALYINKLNKEDTYIVVSNPQQTESIQKIMNDPRIKLLFTSPLAVNTNHGHGKAPRNTLWLFELAE